MLDEKPIVYHLQTDIEPLSYDNDEKPFFYATDKMMSDELKLVMRMVMNALQDAIGGIGGRQNPTDWVSILVARDWLRYKAKRLIVESAEYVPDGDWYERWLAGCEETWESMDAESYDDDAETIAALEPDLPIPYALGELYMMDLWSKFMRSIKRIDTANEILATIADCISDQQDAVGLSNAMAAVMVTHQSLFEASSRLNAVQEKLNRFRDLVHFRGILDNDQCPDKGADES